MNFYCDCTYMKNIQYLSLLPSILFYYYMILYYMYMYETDKVIKLYSGCIQCTCKWSQVMYVYSVHV